MENASKALLIAGAILIAIVLISLGVMILGQGSDLVKNANMSDAEITTYNSEFEQYLGGNVRGNMLIQMVNKVNQHNRANAGDTSKQISVEIGDGKKATGKVVEIPSKDVSTISTSSIKSGKAYEVTADYSSGGLICKIYAQEVNKAS